jgi:hypothetical protein
MIWHIIRRAIFFISNFFIFTFILILVGASDLVPLFETILITCLFYFFVTLLFKIDKTKILIMTLIFYFIYSFLLVNIDRSRSFYVLSWVKLYQISSDLPHNLNQIKSSEAINRSAISQRLAEQKTRGLIKEEGGYLKLTNIGNFLFSISNLFAKIFNLSNWFYHKY